MEIDPLGNRGKSICNICIITGNTREAQLARADIDVFDSKCGGCHVKWPQEDSEKEVRDG